MSRMSLDASCTLMRLDLTTATEAANTPVSRLFLLAGVFSVPLFIFQCAKNVSVSLVSQAQTKVISSNVILLIPADKNQFFSDKLIKVNLFFMLRINQRPDFGLGLMKRLDNCK